MSDNQTSASMLPDSNVIRMRQHQYKIGDVLAKHISREKKLQRVRSILQNDAALTQAKTSSLSSMSLAPVNAQRDLNTIREKLNHLKTTNPETVEAYVPVYAEMLRITRNY